jgi:SAM-dependent methyltransferase
MTIREKITTIISYILHPQKRKLISLAKRFQSKTGIEIGGPSSFFSIKSYLPIYLYAKTVDGVNFSTNTLWEGNISEGKNFNYYANKIGYQYISEASDLSKIDNNKYDFIASCHCLEHTANPIKALSEWNRVTKNGGYFILILPDKNFTFDNKRPYTLFEHLKQDFENNIDETDSTHFDEVINLHDIEKDQGVKNREELIERTNNNFINRSVHHHVFSFDVIKEMLAYTGFKTLVQTWVAPFHLVTIAQKVS